MLMYKYLYAMTINNTPLLNIDKKNISLMNKNPCKIVLYMNTTLISTSGVSVCTFKLLQRVWLLEGYNNYAFHWTGVAVAIF